MISDQIKADTIAAMKSGDSLRLSVLRMLTSALGYKQIDLHRDLTDEDVLAVIASEAKKRKEAIASYTAAGRTDSANKEAEELKILQAYLPILMTEEEVRNEVTKILSNQVTKDFGQAMKIVAPMFKGRADGGIVASVVKQLIS